MRHALALLVLLASCDTPLPAPETVPLSPRQQLIRLSVDLRGVHPTETELQAIDETPGLYGLFVEDYLEDPRFIKRLKELYSYRFLTRNGDTYFDPQERGLGGIPEHIVADAIANEPLELLEFIVRNDLPFSYLVTAPHSMANPVLAQMWDLDYPEGAEGWQPATYKDGRPHAGILSMNTIWQRYPSMGGNANRHRANAISKMLLCDDYLSRPIVLDRAAVDLLTVDPENAINITPSCQSCHSTLDPLAGTLFGFFTYDDDEGFDQTRYRPERERDWVNYSGKAPGFAGTPVANLVELGQRLADDIRVADCAVETIFEGLTQRDSSEADWQELHEHQDHFLTSNQNMKALVRSIVRSDTYRAQHLVDNTLDQRIPTQKMLSPHQLESVVRDLTGYTWRFDGRPGLSASGSPLQVLAGGIDGQFVTEPSYVPSIGTLFTVERLAQSAGWHVASHDLDPDRVDEAILLRFVTIQDTPESSPEAFEAQIRSLYLDLTGVPLETEATEPAELVQLYKYLHSVQASPTAAWAGVVSVVLRDPQLLFY